MTDTKPARETVDPGDVRNRSRSSGFELLKTTISLATAGVGVFFVSLTKDFTGFKSAQKAALVVAIVFMVLAVLSGLLAWAADAAFYKRWADVLRGKVGASWEARERAKKARGALIAALVIFFAVGIFAAGVFGLLRAA